MVLGTWDENSSKENDRLLFFNSFSCSGSPFPSTTSLQEYRYQAHFPPRALATQVLEKMTSNLFEGEVLKICRSENTEISQNVAKPYEELGSF